MTRWIPIALAAALLGCGDEEPAPAPTDPTSSSGATTGGGTGACTPTEGSVSLTWTGGAMGSLEGPCTLGTTAGDRSTITFFDENDDDGFGGSLVFTGADRAPNQYTISHPREGFTCNAADLTGQGNLDGTATFTRDDDSGWTLEVDMALPCCPTEGSCDAGFDIQLTGTLSEEAAL